MQVRTVNLRSTGLIWHALNLKNIEAETTQAQVQQVAEKYQQITQAISQSLAAIGTIQDAATQDQLNRIEKEANASTTSAARKAVLAKQQERIEQQQHERKKKFAIAQALIDGSSAIVSILAQYPKFDFGIAAYAGMALAAVTTAAQIRAISSQKFAVGGVVQGPSHAQGGIQMYHRSGAHLGEMEGGETILVPGVFRNRALRAAASALNVAGGGRPFYVDHLEGSTLMAQYAQGGVVNSSAMYLPQVRTGGVVQQIVAGPTIDYDLLAAKLAPAFVAGAQALPAPNVNLTELRERQGIQERAKQQTDI